jgi:hypothetical protein
MSTDTKNELEVLKSEALADADDLTKVPLGSDGQIVEVLPQRVWRSSALDALNNGRFGEWAEKCLTEDGYDTWEDVDPTLEEIEEFFAAVGEANGMSPLASRRLRRSAARARKR